MCFLSLRHVTCRTRGDVCARAWTMDSKLLVNLKRESPQLSRHTCDVSAYATRNGRGRIIFVCCVKPRRPLRLSAWAYSLRECAAQTLSNHGRRLSNLSDRARRRKEKTHALWRRRAWRGAWTSASPFLCVHRQPQPEAVTDVLSATHRLQLTLG